MKTHGGNIIFAINSLRFSRILLAILFLSPTIGQTEIYKWVDEDGKVHFDDRVGTGNKEKIEVKTTDTSSNPNAELQENVDQENKLLEIYEEERKEKNLKISAQQEEENKLKEKCAKAKKYKNKIDTNSRLFIRDEKGDRVFLNEEEIDTKAQKLNEFIDKNCK